MTLIDIILTLTVVFVGETRVVHVRHMRSSPGPEARAQALAHAFEVAGDTYGLSPRLLAALAFAETGYNGALVSSKGAVGVMQLHPRGEAGRAYLRACREPSPACDAWSVVLGAEVLRGCLDACGESELAIGCYRTGWCGENGRTQYVMNLWKWMEGE